MHSRLQATKSMHEKSGCTDCRKNFVGKFRHTALRSLQRNQVALAFPPGSLSQLSPLFRPSFFTQVHQSAQKLHFPQVEVVPFRIRFPAFPPQDQS